MQQQTTTKDMNKQFNLSEGPQGFKSLTAGVLVNDKLIQWINPWITAVSYTPVYEYMFLWFTDSVRICFSKSLTRFVHFFFQIPWLSSCGVFFFRFTDSVRICFSDSLIRFVHVSWLTDSVHIFFSDSPTLFIRFRFTNSVRMFLWFTAVRTCFSVSPTRFKNEILIHVSEWCRLRFTSLWIRFSNSLIQFENEMPNLWFWGNNTQILVFLLPSWKFTKSSV